MAQTVSEEYLTWEAGRASIDGLLRRAQSGAGKTVVIQTHPRRTSFDNATAWPMAELPQAGIDTFAFNNRFTNSEAGIDTTTIWELMILDVAAAVNLMRSRGYENVILYGWSAGGTLVTIYQRTATEGRATVEEMASRSLTDFSLPKESCSDIGVADGVILQSSTQGTARSFLQRLDGSIVDERLGTRDPLLDMFEERNGYDPQSGHGEYAEEFLAQYYEAQRVRMERLVSSAQDGLAEIKRGHTEFADDTFMVIPAVRACPALVDRRLASSTDAEWRVVPDNAFRTVSSTRSVVEKSAILNRRCVKGTAVHTLTSFLSYRAVPSYDAGASTLGRLFVNGSELLTNNCTSYGVAGFDTPLLITHGTADDSVYVTVAEDTLHHARSEDRELIFVQGAMHDMSPAAGAHADTRQAHLDCVTEWIASRYL